MPIDTPLNGPLGIRHPVLLAPMDVIAGARLTAAVSRAGGFGILGGGYGDRGWLEQETGKLRGVQAPFGIGFITWSLARQPELLDVALAARPRAIMLSFGDPKPFALRIKAAGAREVLASSSHAVLSGHAVEKIEKSPLSKLIVTNSIPLSPEKRSDKIVSLSIAKLLGRAIKNIHDETSVTSLFV